MITVECSFIVAWAVALVARNCRVATKTKLKFERKTQFSSVERTHDVYVATLNRPIVRISFHDNK